MSHPGKPVNETGLNFLADKFQDSFILDQNKPDFKELDLDVPLITRSVSAGGANNPSTTTTTPPTSRSYSPSPYHIPVAKRSNGTASTHPGALETTSKTSENHRSMATAPNSRPGHRRSNSTGAPLIYSGYMSPYNSCSTTSSSTTTSGGGGSNAGGSSVSSPNPIRYPTGNICPSGRILKSNMSSRNSSRTDTLASGTGNYGHGSIIKGGGGGKLDNHVYGNMHFGGEVAVVVKRAMGSCDPEEVKKAGNDLYMRGNFAEALSLYDRAIMLSPESAAYRSNRAAALTMLGRLGAAVSECEEAVRLDPGHGRAHQRLACLYIRLGQVENARCHLSFHGQQADMELQKLHVLEKHLSQCAEARKTGDWKRALRECDGAMVAGADSCPQIIACKAEALLKLHQPEDADSSLSEISNLEPYPASCSQTKFFGMLSDAYVFFVQALVHMALGRFENAVAATEKAGLIDQNNTEVARLLNNVKFVSRARARGKELFDYGRYTEACSAYGEGLKYNLCNSVLYCNRAVCWSKLCQWEQSVDDCNRALKIHPNYTKALLRRAVSNAKLERWAEAVRDYEILRRELPGDHEVAESLSRTQIALKKSCEGVQNLKFGEMEEIFGLDQFKIAISSAAVSVVHFMVASNQQCEQIASFIDSLCVRYPSVNFLKVDVEESPAVAKAESIRIVPTFNIYQNGGKVKEMICPSHQGLESLVRQYSL